MDDPMMLRATMIVLAGAVALGLALALWHLRASKVRPSGVNWIGIVHGGLGAAGLALLALAVSGPPRGAATGTSQFGLVAAILFGGALLVGVTLPFLLRRRSPISGTVMAVHAGIAITGMVIALAWAAFD
jgi:hypothetical protein